VKYLVGVVGQAGVNPIYDMKAAQRLAASLYPHYPPGTAVLNVYTEDDWGDIRYHSTIYRPVEKKDV
jgi:hypothetical protein